ncbi:hypothetical protein Tco_0928823 [Tanacetum coccineum]
MKAIKSDLEAELPIVLTHTVSDFVQEFMGVKKPDKVKVKNPTGVRPKGREKQKHIKSGREISMKKIIFLLQFLISSYPSASDDFCHFQAVLSRSYLHLYFVTSTDLLLSIITGFPVLRLKTMR